MAVLIVLTGKGPGSFAHMTRRRMTFLSLYEACSKEGIDMLLTTPDKVDTRTGMCRGWTPVGSGKAWKSRQHPLQSTIVYDAMYLADLKVHRRTYRKLIGQASRFGTVVFNPKLPAKDEMHTWLTDVDGGVGILPKTLVNISDAGNVLDELKITSGARWFKPAIGSGGRNMLYILPLEQDLYRVRGERFFTQNLNVTWTKETLTRQLQRALDKRPYLLQDDVGLLETKDGRKVDFRVTLARGRKGIWAVTAITARFAQSGGTLTNYHAGGSIQSLTDMGYSARAMLKHIGLTQDDVGRVANVATEVARRLSNRHPHVGLLGVDVGIGKFDGQALVYDCNSRPGRDILSNREVKTTMRQVSRFASHLLDKSGSFDASCPSRDMTFREWGF